MQQLLMPFLIDVPMNIHLYVDYLCKKYAGLNNDLYDGNRNSYDMMVLVSGAQEKLGFRKYDRVLHKNSVLFPSPS